MNLIKVKKNFLFMEIRKSWILNFLSFIEVNVYIYAIILAMSTFPFQLMCFFELANFNTPRFKLFF